MIFKGLKERILKKQLLKGAQQVAGNVVVSSKKIKTVGVLTTTDIDAQTDLKALVEKTLGVRNVKLYCYRPFDKRDELSYKHFSENDMSWSGKFTQTNIESFMAQPFDLLIGYFNTNNLYLELGVLQSKATFKVGFSKVNSALFSIEIAVAQDKHTLFLSELEKYLKILKKL